LLEEIDRNGKLALKLVEPLERKEGAGSSAPSDDRPLRNDRDRGGDRGGDRGDRGRPREGGGGNRDRGDRGGGSRPERRPAEVAQTGDSRRKAVSFEDVFDNLPKP